VKFLKIVFGVVAGFLVLMVIAMIVSSRYMYRWINQSIIEAPYEISPAASRLHDTLLIADLHMDSAVHLVDFSMPQPYGHVGRDRLIAGGLSLMTLSLPTEVTIDRWRVINGMAIGGIVNGQPFNTWFSNFNRGEFFAERILGVVARNPDRMVVIRNRDDLRALLQSWAPGGDRKLGIIMGGNTLRVLSQVLPPANQK